MLHEILERLSHPETPETVATPSARELAKQWLHEHPEHADKSLRWLEQNVRPMGVQISRPTWGRARKKK